ncbi:substrate-binding periplasmic protein [Roseisolibacter agri]|uniref:substrate-binding periplasmic protein n=1 Tax=Roseisolibacter agri TaxID=2014610 RepID=UPI0024E06F9B|nr:transporter substrate-binding domain-containing protein [Roseisolibacter agri]
MQLRRGPSQLPALALLALLAGAEPPRRETIDIGVEDAAAPWSQADGTGYANDVARAAFAAVGVDLRMHVLPYARCKQHVVRGELIACVSMSPAPELDGVVRFSAKPLFVFACDFFENPARPLPPRIADFRPGTRVGTVLGYEYPLEMMEALRRSGAVLEATPMEELNLRKLAVGRLDAAIVNRDAVKSPDWVAARAGVTGKVRSVFRTGGMPAYVGFSLVHRGGAALAARFDAGHARIIASGERDRIQRRWIARNASAGATRAATRATTR